jgi:hypothetical protein
MQTNAVIRWRGGAYSILLWAPWPYSETKQIIFSAQNSNDIDGRCSESNLVSFLREKISTSQMLIAFAQMLIACWSAYISLAQNKNRWMQKFLRSCKSLACFANSQPRDINWSCEIRELRSIRCFEFSFLVFPFHSKCEWLTFTVLLSLQRREVEAEQIDVAKVLVKNYTCKCLRWFPVFSFLLVFRSNFKWSNAGFVARLRCMDSSAVHRAVLKYIVGTTWSLLSAISRR